jgi:hypothetical protein
MKHANYNRKEEGEEGVEMQAATGGDDNCHQSVASDGHIGAGIALDAHGESGERCDSSHC